MYFPQLVAGPIERPQNLLHQFKEVKYFNWQRFSNGVSLSLWGLFKKVVVADSLAIYTDTIYNNSRQHTGTSLLLATYFFAIQIYCDFSGYSDIARGISRIYGIKLMKNFETPYFARSISEFWSRWHISLSTWFRDYVYIPLGGNRVSLARNMFNIGLVFLISGLWHGANWTFVIWGALHGIYYLVWRTVQPATPGPTATVRVSRAWSYLRDGFLILLTFHLVLLSWIFFRAANLSTALDTLRRIAVDHGPLFWDPIIVQGVLAILLLVALDVFHRRTGFWDALDRFPKWPRFAYSVALLFGIVLFGVDTGTQFIYFQF
jgi:D-alanyl-lipoteichoic acid acyltransferase DltB (MBOAT superfamily)